MTSLQCSPFFFIDQAFNQMASSFLELKRNSSVTIAKRNTTTAIATDKTASDLLRVMIQRGRFVCSLDAEGRITLTEVPLTAILANPDQLAAWIADPDGLPDEYLAEVLQAVKERLAK